MITHFHTDHICGLTQAYEASKEGYNDFRGLFDKIYIPDVWGNPFVIATTLLEELVLRIQLKNAKLPRTSAVLFELIEFLCTSESDVKLLSRGVTFENDKYLTLWPCKKNEETETWSILTNFGFPMEFVQDLGNFSQRLCDYVETVLEYRGNDIQLTRHQIDLFREEYQEIIGRYETQIYEVLTDDDFRERTHKKLNEKAHDYNIVFHDNIDGDENVLFTGDAEIEHMNKISTDTEYPLHPKYKFVKVPHHGTPNHYYDFSPFNPDYILISNGAVSGRSGIPYKIDERYGDLSAKHICSNSNNCSYCVRRGPEIIRSCNKCIERRVFPKLYKKIR